MWISRDLGAFLDQPALPARVLVGPRQSGKSSLLAQHLPQATWISLDDIQVRRRAQDDPALLLESAGLADGRPIILDEAALAPALFPEIKRRIDESRRAGRAEPSIWITGSNRQLLDNSVRESLAGRASYFFLHTLSTQELGDRASIADWMIRGGFPELYARTDLDPARYLADYVRTFVERDVAATAGILQVDGFLRALQLLAARTGTLLNATDIGQQSGVKGQTVTQWLDTLQRNALVVRLPPFHTNLNKRVVRTPKVYFLDTGLAAHLQGWRTAEPMLASPQAGPLFETLVFGELIRARDHCGLGLELSFWRTKEGEEIDFLIRTSGVNGAGWIAIEAKFSIQQVDAVPVPVSLARTIPEVTETWVVTPGGAAQQLSATSTQVPIRQLTQRLFDRLGA